MGTSRSHVSRAAVAFAVMAGLVAVDPGWGWAQGGEAAPAARGDDEPPDEDEAPPPEEDEAPAPDEEQEEAPAPDEEQDKTPAPDDDDARRRDSRTPSHPGGVDDTCPEILRGPPGDNLTKETDPPDGTPVLPGDEITVTLTWDLGHFADDALHKALDCVTIDGVLATDLSVQKRDTENDGEFVHTYRIPDDAEPGTMVCDRGFVSGDGSSGQFEREKSNDVCFEVSFDDEDDDEYSPLELLPFDLR